MRRGLLGELAREWTIVRVASSALVGSYAGIWLAQIALERTPSVGVATALLSTAPVFALPIAHLAGERITARALFGAVVAVVGIALLTL